MEHGIKETCEVIELGLAVGGGIAESLKNDGQITFGDISNFTPVASKVMPAINDITKIPAELADLSDEEAVEIRNMILAKMPEVGEKWVNVAKGALQAGLGVLTVVNALRA